MITIELILKDENNKRVEVFKWSLLKNGKIKDYYDWSLEERRQFDRFIGNVDDCINEWRAFD